MRVEGGTAVARALRRKSTRAEHRLWRSLRGRRLSGFKFRRQHPMAGYVLDFYCAEARLAVEVDGGGHTEPKQVLHDRQRELKLMLLEIRVLRFWNNEVMNDLQAVLSVILEALQERSR